MLQMWHVYGLILAVLVLNAFQIEVVIFGILILILKPQLYSNGLEINYDMLTNNEEITVS